MDTTSAQFAFLPRAAGQVDSYTVGVATPGTFGTLPIAVSTATTTSVTTPAVPDDYDPGQALVVGGSNVDVKVVPFIPTKEQANNLMRLINAGATPEAVAFTIAKLTYAIGS